MSNRTKGYAGFYSHTKKKTRITAPKPKPNLLTHIRPSPSPRSAIQHAEKDRVIVLIYNTSPKTGTSLCFGV